MARTGDMACRRWPGILAIPLALFGFATAYGQPDPQPSPAPAPSIPDAPATPIEPGESPPDAEPTAAEKKIVFSFSKTPWDVALARFAELADLQLILKFKPPGTFDYQSSKAVTIPEAIDILNEVLIAEGFVVLRTDRFLTLAPLDQPLPLNQVPVVMPDELSKRGRNEFVTIVQRLAFADPATVEADVKRLLGPHGQVQSVPGLKILRLTDQAVKLEEVLPLIKEIDEKAKPDAPKPDPAPPPPATRKLHPLKILSAEKAIELLKAVLGTTGKLEPAPDGKTIIAVVPDAEHDAIDQFLKEIDLPGTKGDEPLEQSFPLESARADRVATILQSLFPKDSGLTVAGDASSNVVVVKGPARDVEQIQVLVTIFDKKAKENAPIQEVYRPLGADASGLAKALQQAFVTKDTTDVAVTFDEQNQAILVSAPPRIQAQIRAFLEKFGGSALEGAETTAVVGLKHASAVKLAATLETVFPKATSGATFGSDENSNAIVIRAPAQALERIQRIIADLDLPPTVMGLREKEEEIFEPKHARAAELVRSAESLYPTSTNVVLVLAAGGTKVVVSAPPVLLPKVRSTLELLDRAAQTATLPSERAYSLRHADVAGLVKTLGEIFPADHYDIRFVPDSANRRLLVIAGDDAVHQRIAAMVNELDTPSPESEVVEIHEVKNVSAGELVETLQRVFPAEEKATFQVQRDGKGILIRASAQIQSRVAELLAKIDVPSDQTAPAAVDELYKLQYAKAAELVVALQKIYPAQSSNVRISAEPTNNVLIVTAPPDVQDRIRALIEKVDVPSESRMQLEIYRPKDITPSSLASLINQMGYPDVGTVVASSDNRALLVVATKTTQERIRNLLALADTTDPNAEMVRKSYRIENVAGTTMASMLQTLFPAAGPSGATIVADPSGKQVIVQAPPRVQNAIAEVIKESDVPTAMQESLITARHVTVGSLYTQLSGLFSGVDGTRFSYDTGSNTIGVLATPAMKEKVLAFVEKFDQPVDAATGKVRETYKMRFVPAGNIYSALVTLFPAAETGVSFNYESSNQIVLAVATAEQQKRIKAEIEKLDVDPRSSWVIRAIHPKNTSASELLTFLTTQLAGVTNKSLSLGAREDDVMIHAPPEVQNEVDRLIAAFDVPPPEGVEKVRKIYRPVHANAYYMYLNLLSSYPTTSGVKLSYDSYSNTVTVVASPQDQETIAQDVAALDENPRKNWIEKTFRPQTMTADQLVTFLTSALSTEANKTLTASPDGQLLVAIAPPPVMERIDKLVATLDLPVAEGGESTPKAYVVKYASAGSVYTLLTQLYPPASGVKYYYDSTNNTVTVFASPAVHEKIATVVASMDVDPNAGRAQKVFTPKNVPAPQLVTLLQTALAAERSTSIALGPQKQTVVVFAPLESMARIEKYIETLDTTEAAETTRQLYKLQYGNASYLVGTLQALYPPAQYPVVVSVDPGNNILVVEAPALIQQKISELIQDLDVQQGGRTQVVYRLEHTRASSVLTSLQGVLGSTSAAAVAGPDDRSLVVNAMPAEHERVKGFLATFDTAENSQDPQSRAYNLRYATASNVARMISQLYANDPKVRVTYDDQRNTLFVTAPPAQMEKIEPLINDSDQEGAESRMVNQVFRLRDASANDVARALTNSFPDRKKAIFTADSGTRTVVARAVPELSEDIRKMIEDLDQPRVLPERETAVFDLYNVDAFDAQGIVGRLFEDLPQEERPRLESTWDPPRLIVRAAAGQMKEIREVIAKVEGQATPAEGQAAATPGATILDKPAERVLRVSEADPAATARAIQQVWSLLRKNKLNIIYRQGPLGAVAPDRKPGAEEAAPPEPPSDVDAALLPGEPTIPVTIIVGNDRLTVSSRDVEALDLVQSLTDAWTRPFDPNRSASRVFYIESTDVVELARAIDEAFNGKEQRGDDRRRFLRPERVRIVAEPNSNALIVRASPVDLINVKELIDQLDLPPATEKKPRIIPLRAAEAQDVLVVIQKVFADYLLPGSGPPLNVPGVTGQAGRSRTTAMSIDIDERSNSLVVSAPDSVLAEVETLVQGLEAAAADTEKSYRVLPIENTSPTDVRNALEMLLDRQLKSTQGPSQSRPTPNRPTKSPRTRTKRSSDARPGAETRKPLVAAPSSAAPDKTAVTTIRPTSNGVQVSGQWPKAGGNSDTPDKAIQLASATQDDDALVRDASLQEEQPAAPPQGPSAGVAAISGNVDITVLEDIGFLLLIGSERDLELLTEIVRQIEKAASSRELTFELYPLQNTKAIALADLLNELYSRILDSRGQLTRVQAQATVIPLAKPNALLLVAGKDEIGELADLARKFDVPVPAKGEYRLFRLKHIRAALLVQTIESFYDDRRLDGDLAPEVVVQPDDRSNTLIVYAAPNDMAEVASIIRELDTAQTARVNELRIFYLRHTVATELAQVLEQAISGRGATTSGPATTATARGGPPALVVTDPDNPDIRMNSGILDNVTITPNRRANAVLVSAPKETMRVIDSLIRQMDVLPEAVAEIKVFTLINSDAATLLQTLRALFAQLERQQSEVAVATTPAATSEAPSLVELSFSVDERTNSILVSGSREQLEVVEAIILRLDASDIEERRTDVYRLKNAPAQDVASALTELLSQQQQLAGIQEGTSLQQQLEREIIVVPEPISNSLLISSSPRFYDSVVALIEKLDELPPQVVIQVLLAQVQLDGDAELGVELGLQDGILFQRSNQNSNLRNETNPFFTDGATPGFNFNSGGPLGNNIFAPNSANVAGQGLSNFSLGRMNDTLGFGGLVLSASSESVSILIRALARERRLEVLSRPQIMTLDNQTASIVVGAEVPRIRGAILVQGAGVTQDIEYVPSGIILEVTPKINPDGSIVMQLSPEISRLAPANDPEQNIIISPGVSARALEITKALTTVSAQDGETVMIGGLIRKSMEKEERKVPCLGDIPVMGHLFRYDRLTERRSELLIILTPHVVRSRLDAERIKAIEAERMHWCLSDVEAIHGDLGLPTEVYLGDLPEESLDADVFHERVIEERILEGPTWSEPMDESIVPPEMSLPGPDASSGTKSAPTELQPVRLKSPVLAVDAPSSKPSKAARPTARPGPPSGVPRTAIASEAPPATNATISRDQAKKSRMDRDSKIYQPLMERRREQFEAWKTRYLPWKRQAGAQ